MARDLNLHEMAASYEKYFDFWDVYDRKALLYWLEEEYTQWGQWYTRTKWHRGRR